VKVSFTSSFEKDLRKIRQNVVRAAVREAILRIEASQHPGEVVDLKKLKKGTAYYRLRIGDYRLGMLIEGDIVTFVRCLHRSEIYRYFP